MTFRIHIVGSSPRTGTTLMYELMVNGFFIDGHDAVHEVSIFRRPSPAFRVYVSKNPGDVRYVRPLLWIDRRLWIIHMVRDPRDVVVSSHGKAPEQYYTNLRIWKSRRRAVRRVERHPRFITIRYEDLVNDANRIQDRLLDQMSFLEARSRFSEFHDTACPGSDSVLALKTVRPIKTDSVGAWRQHKPRLAAQLALHGSIGADLRELGYESKSNWHEAMDGVTPNNGDSLLPDHVPQHALRQHLRVIRGTARYTWSMLQEKLSGR